MNVRRELEDVTGRGVTIGSVYATLDTPAGEVTGIIRPDPSAATADFDAMFDNVEADVMRQRHRGTRLLQVDVRQVSLPEFECHLA